jgi:glycosyltransferase involved in cell wall biosynthesis
MSSRSPVAPLDASVHRSAPPNGGEAGHVGEPATGGPGRIAYLISQYPTVSHTFILREVRGLRARGFDLRVIAIRGPDRPPERLTAAERDEARATYYVLGSGVGPLIRAHLATLWRRPRAYLGALWEAIEPSRLDLRHARRALAYWAEAAVVGDWMAREGVTHVHTHFTSHVGRFVARMFPVTYSATVHGPTELENRLQYGLRARVAAATFVCTSCHYVRAQLLLECPPEAWSKVDVVRLGVDTRRYRPARRAPRAGPGAPLNVLCVARLSEQKGHHILIAAAEALHRGGVDFHLHLVGDGPLRTSLESEVRRRGLETRVVFRGARNEQEVLELYAQADVFALTSFAEGVPVSLMEAMAMGIPCVATQVSGTPELIRNGIDGLLIPPADAAAAAEALARLAGDPALRARLGTAGRQRVRAEYDFEVRVDHLADVLRARGFAAHVAPAGVA